MALTTEAQVCNLALGLVGQRQVITNLNEATEEAMSCATFYAVSRDECLAARWWRFATSREVLALSTEKRAGWALAYAAPSQMLPGGERYIYSGGRAPAAKDRIPFAVELNDAASGHLILTDKTEAELVFTRQFNTVALWPPLFTVAVAARLAVNLAFVLTVKPALGASIESKAQFALARAAAVDANAEQPDVEPESDSITVRS